MFMSATKLKRGRPILLVNGRALLSRSLLPSRLEINADTGRLHEQIRGMANNINQIAHVANARRSISQETIREATLLLRLVQEKLDRLHEENLILIEKQAAHAYGKQAE